jgi:hypothetical protein
MYLGRNIYNNKRISLKGALLLHNDVHLHAPSKAVIKVTKRKGNVQAEKSVLFSYS